MVQQTAVGLRANATAASLLTQAQWAVAGGTADAITAAYSTPNTALTDGMILGFRATTANATTTPTFKPDSLAASIITRSGGNPLLPADIPGALAEMLVRYNQANNHWELLNPAYDPQWWAVASGGTNITATYPCTLTLYDGLLLGFRAAADNTTTTPTFSPNSLAAHTITHSGGVALDIGDVGPAGKENLIRYNLANTRWELLNPSSGPSFWTAATGVDTITATYVEGVTSLVNGLLVGIRSAGDNLTTTPTFSPNSLTPHTITRNGGDALLPGDLGKANAEKLLRYNSSTTAWELLNPKIINENFYILAADDTNGLNSTSAQPWFPTAGGVTLLGATTYAFDGLLYTSRSAGTTSHTTSLLFASGGGGSLTSIMYHVSAMTGDANALVTDSGVVAVAATAVVVKAASTSATEQSIFKIKGIVRTNAAGTFTPQFQYSVAPGGAPTIKANSYFRMDVLGSSAIVTRGTWA